MLFMELSVGQYTGRGPIGALGQICPLFKGEWESSLEVFKLDKCDIPLRFKLIKAIH